MAGDWIKFESATPDKPEVWELSDSLDLDPDAVIGKLLRVWIWFDQHTEEGNAPIVTKKLLDRSVGVTGFCDCLISCGWMSESGGRITLPNFHRHNGKTAKNRALTAKRVAAHKEKTNANGNGEVTPDALPREEKRREDKESTPKPETGRKITFDAWVAKIKIEGQKPIPDDHAVIKYAEDAGIPQDYLAVCWEHFKGRYTGDTKRYIDWRKVFHNAVRENWFKLWWLDSGEYKLTTVGQQGLMALKNKKGDQ